MGADPTIPFVGMVGHGSPQAGAPKAYLNTLVLDRNRNYVSSAFVQVGTSAKESGAGDTPHQYLKISPITIKEPGYVYIYTPRRTRSIERKRQAYQSVPATAGRLLTTLK